MRFCTSILFFWHNVAHSGTLWHTMTQSMGRVIEIQRICQHCNTTFIAKRTTTKYCSTACNSRAYKKKKRDEKIKASNKETIGIINQPLEELKVKEFLSITDASRLLGISRRTIYRMIDRKELPFAKFGNRTILKRVDIDNHFNKPLPIRVKKEPQPVTEFYTVKEVEEIHHIKYGRLNTIIKKHNIPKTLYNGKLRVSKPHLDRYFKKVREDVSTITEWYSIAEAMKKHKLSRDQVYSRVHDNNIPKQRLGKYIRISKIHFDELFIIGV